MSYVHSHTVLSKADSSNCEDEAEDSAQRDPETVKGNVQWGEVIRLEIEGKIDKRLLDILKEEFAVKDSDVI